MTKALSLLAKFSLLIVVVVVVAIGFLTYTQTGTHWLLGQIESRSNNQLSIAHIDGRLAGPLTLNGIAVSNESTKARIGQIKLQWSPAALLRRKVSLNNLTIDDVSVTLTPATDDSKPPSDFQMPDRIDLPIDVQADMLRLSNFELITKPGAKPLIISEAKLGLMATAQKIQVSSLSVSGDLVDLSGQLTVDNDNSGALDGKLDLQLRPAGVTAVRGTTVIGGQLRAPHIELSLDQPYTSHSIATLDLSRQPPGIDATVKTELIEVNSIKPGIPPIPLAIDVQLDGVTDQLNVQTSTVAHATDDIAATVELSAVVSPSRVDVSELTIDSADISAKLRGTGWLSLQPFGEIDLNFDLTDLNWPLQGTAQIEVPTVTMSVDGTLPTLNIATEVAVAAEPTMTIVAEGVVQAEKDAAVDIAVNWSKARWPLFGDALVISENGNVKIEGGTDNLTVNGSAGLGTRGEIFATAQRLDEKLNAKVEWTNLGWPLVEADTSSPVVSSPKGMLLVEGLPDDYQLTLTGLLEALDDQATDVSVQGNGDRSSFAFSRLMLTGDAGNINGTGDVSWAKPWQVAMRLEGEDINPGAVAAEWPGSLQLSVDAKASASANNAPESIVDALNATIEKLTIDGELRGYPLSVNAFGSLLDGVVEIDKANLSSGQTTAVIDGRIDEKLDLKWQVNSPSLKALLPSAAGRLTSDGQLSGSIENPVVSATLNGSAIKYLDNAIGAIDITADWFAEGVDPSRLSLVAKDGSIAGVTVQTLELTGGGTPEQHQAQMRADTDYGRINLNAVGGLGAASWVASPWKWSGLVETIEFTYPQLPPWQLRTPFSITASAESVSVERACFDSADAGLCAVAETKKAAVEAELTLEKLPFNYIKDFLPEATTLAGSVDGQVQFKRDLAGNLSIDSSVNTTAGEFAIRSTDDSGQSPTTIEFEPSSVQASLVDKKLSAKGDLRLANNDGATISIDVENPLDGFENATLSGSVDGRIRDVGMFNSLSDQISNLQGKFAANVQIAGTVAAPKLEGEITVAEGGVAVPQIGVDVTKLQLQLRGDPTGDIAVNADAMIGEGAASLHGSVSFAETGLRGKLNLSGKDLQVYQTADADVWINPALDFTLEDRVFGVSGAVTVPRASIKPVALPESAIAASGDQVFVDVAEPETTEPPLNIRADIDLIMGDDVQIDAFGLQGELGGQLSINETPDEPTSATGELSIANGRYDAYGQNLDIERGRVIFSGGQITQPGIDLRAISRPTEEITVGVSALGTLEQPNFTLFSEPAMTQRDQLSYLLLGQAADELGQGESSAISQAEMALGLKGAKFLADKVGNKFGVDTFKVDTEAGEGTSTAALLIGKYLSPKLYVSYGLGLFGSTSTLRAQYTLNKNWKISTESSEQGAGGDVIFSIDAGN